jgi:glucosamine-6-phosphate deaminase
MASTIKKLVNQGHQVYIAYMTSGSYAVFDHDAKKYLDFFRDFIIE